METASVYYTCCQGKYAAPLVKVPADSLLRVIDAIHDAEHPRCSRANPPWTEIKK